MEKSVKDASRKRGIMERCGECDRKRKGKYRKDPESGPRQRVKVRDANRALRRERKAAGMHWSDSLTEEKLEQRRAWMRKYNREKNWAKIGATPEYYAAKLAEQDGKCAICESAVPWEDHDGRQYFCIDHDHKTGVLRDLLCHDCNLIIGHAADDPARLQAAAEYLALWLSTTVTFS